MSQAKGQTESVSVDQMCERQRQRWLFSDVDVVIGGVELRWSWQRVVPGDLERTCNRQDSDCEHLILKETQEEGWTTDSEMVKSLTPEVTSKTIDSCWCKGRGARHA